MANGARARRMTALVQQWETSGECKAAFLRRHDVSRSAFDYWKRRVRRPETAPGPVVFAPVQLVSTPVGEEATVVVVLTTGERLIVPSGVSAEHVRTIVMALRTGC